MVHLNYKEECYGHSKYACSMHYVPPMDQSNLNCKTTKCHTTNRHSWHLIGLLSRKSSSFHTFGVILLALVLSLARFCLGLVLSSQVANEHFWLHFESICTVLFCLASRFTAQLHTPSQDFIFSHPLNSLVQVGLQLVASPDTSMCPVSFVFVFVHPTLNMVGIPNKPTRVHEFSWKHAKTLVLLAMWGVMRNLMEINSSGSLTRGRLQRVKGGENKMSFNASKGESTVQCFSKILSSTSAQIFHCCTNHNPCICMATLFSRVLFIYLFNYSKLRVQY